MMKTIVSHGYHQGKGGTAVPLPHENADKEGKRLCFGIFLKEPGQIEACGD